MIGQLNTSFYKLNTIWSKWRHFDASLRVVQMLTPGGQCAWPWWASSRLPPALRSSTSMPGSSCPLSSGLRYRTLLKASFAVIYVYAGELIPTVVRTQVGRPPPPFLQERCHDIFDSIFYQKTLPGPHMNRLFFVFAKIFDYKVRKSLVLVVNEYADTQLHIALGTP